MTAFLSSLQIFLEKLSTLIGKSVAWLCFAMMALTCLAVLLRYIFNVSVTALQESVVYLHGMVFMLGIAYTFKEKGHVRVDIFYNRFSRRHRIWVDLLGTLFFLLPFSGFIFWLSLDYVAFSWSMKESSSEPGGLPGIYLLKSLIPLMSGLLFLQGVAEIIKQLLGFSTSGSLSDGHHR